MACALENDRRGYESKNICICSDSQAALKAPEGCRDKLGLVKDCRSTLQDLAQRNRLTLRWVPVHVGVQGNDRADKLARMSSATLFNGPEPVVGIASCQVKMVVMEPYPIRIIGRYETNKGVHCGAE